MAEPTFADSQTPEPTFADSQTPPMHLVWVMCKVNNGRPFPLLMLFPVFMHVEELANRLQATFLDGGWGGISGGCIRLSSMTSCLRRVGQCWSLVLWCGHLWRMLRSLNQCKAATSISPNPVPAGDGKKAPMAVFQDCMSCLESFHMLHRMVLPPELFFTHSENRSRLMLDPMRARKGRQHHEAWVHI